MKTLNKIKNMIKGNNYQKEWTALADFLGIDKDLSKDERSEATYFACLRILSESVAKLPFKLMIRTETSGVKEARNHPLFSVIRNRPNKFMTSTTFWSTCEYYRNHYGNSVALISGSGRKMQLYPLDYSCIQIWYDNGKILKDTPEIWYVYTYGGKRYIYSSEEILHFKSSISEDGIEALSVREILKSTIKGNQKAQEMHNKL